MNTHIINSERAVLSAYFFDNILIEKSALQENDFYLPFHQNVFNAMKKLSEDENSAIDDVFIKLELEKIGKFDEIAMLDLMSANPITNTVHYEKLIKEASLSRNLDLTLKRLLSSDKTPTEILHELENIPKKFKDKIFNSMPPVHNTKNIVGEKPIFFLEGYLPIQKNEINLLSSKGGGGKSFVSLVIASMLVKRHKLNVFAYLSEDSIQNTKNRLKIVRKANPLIKNVDFDIWGKSERPQAFLTLTKEGLKPSKYWFDFVKHFEKYDVIILDPLIAFIAEDENNNAEARLLFNLMNEWCEKKDKTLIIIHHHSKRDELRGASAFVDAVRIHYVVKEDEESKDNSSRILSLEKDNHLPNSDTYRIKLFGSQSPIVKNNETLNIVVEDDELLTPSMEKEIRKLKAGGLDFED